MSPLDTASLSTRMSPAMSNARSLLTKRTKLTLPFAITIRGLVYGNDAVKTRLPNRCLDVIVSFCLQKHEFISLVGRWHTFLRARSNFVRSYWSVRRVHNSFTRSAPTPQLSFSFSPPRHISFCFCFFPSPWLLVCKLYIYKADPSLLPFSLSLSPFLCLLFCPLFFASIYSSFLSYKFLLLSISL